MTEYGRIFYGEFSADKNSADNLNIGAMQSNGGTSACDVSDFHLIKFNNFNGFFVVSVCIHINVCVCVGVSRF